MWKFFQAIDGTTVGRAPDGSMFCACVEERRGTYRGWRNSRTACIHISEILDSIYRGIVPPTSTNLKQQRAVIKEVRRRVHQRYLYEYESSQEEIRENIRTIHRHTKALKRWRARYVKEFSKIIAPTKNRNWKQTK